MIERLLIPLDGSRRAEGPLGLAAALLSGGGTAVLFHAVAPGMIGAGRERRRAAAYMRGLAARLRRKGIAVRVRLGAGSPPAALVRAALEERADLIAMSSRGRGGAGDWPLGSVARQVLEASPVPVLLFRGAGGSGELRRIVAAIDSTDGSLAVMPVVGEAAAALGARVTLVHAGGHRRSLERAVDVLTRLGVRSRVRACAGRTVEEVARRVGAGLVAVAASRRRVKEQLLHASRRPLLVVPA
jgi:nucleotide-binding universal stress UspA family protein